jgi:hypothetical protein
MFTNNYLLMRKSLFECGGNTSQSAGNFYDASGNIKISYVCALATADIGHWMKYARCQAIIGQDPNKIYPWDSTYAGVYFGSGSKTATKEDFALHEPITSGLEIANTNALVWNNDENGNYSVYSDYVLRNTTDDDIVIREIGIFTPSSKGAHRVDVATNVNYYLMERTVLDDPIVIPSNESRLVSYTVRFNQSEV